MLSDYFNLGFAAPPKLAELNLPEGYPFVPLVAKDWKASERRMLIVIESVDRQDLRSKRFFDRQRGQRDNYENAQLHILPELLDRSFASACRITKEDLQQPSVAFVNFNADKTSTLPPQKQIALYERFASRVLSVISLLRPTDVVVLGDNATHYILSELKHAELSHHEFKRGWVLPCTHGNLRFKLTPSLDLENLYTPRTSDDGDGSADDDDSNADSYGAADLLYFVCRNLTNAMAGRQLYDGSTFNPKAIYVDSVEKFDKLMGKLRSTEPSYQNIAVDTETQSLENINNAIYIIQFAFDSNKGYVLPLDHPRTPFSEEERNYMRKKLRSFFAERSPASLKTLLFLNGMFDLRVIRAALDIQYVYHHIYEVTAAEAGLDENVGLFGSRVKFRIGTEYVSTSYQNLRNMLCYYNCDWYYKAKFSKEERSLAGQFEPNDPDLLLYCAADVTSLHLMRDLQLRRASDALVNNKPRLNPWLRHTLNQMGATANVISCMEQDGSPVDLGYMESLLSKDSPLNRELTSIQAELRNFPTVRTLDKRLMGDTGRKSGLFGDASVPHLFNITKRDHVDTLFHDVMELPVVQQTPTGNRSVGKIFVKEYEKSYREVALFRDYTKTSKLLSTYVKGWIKTIYRSPDAHKHQLLRPSFGFFTIVTGRLNSFGPSLHQVPSRGPTAKPIKRAFAAPVGHLNLSYDFSAHEVRMAALLARDVALANVFRVGQKLRQQWIKNPSDEIKAELKKKGDSHIQSVHLFFNQWVDKAHPLREAVKAVVFGVIYGKSARTLGNDLKKEAFGRVTDQLRTATDPVAIKALRKELKEIEARDWTDFAQSVIDKLFRFYPDLGKFLDRSAEEVKDSAQVVSPIGRVRHLWRVFTGKPGVIAAAIRRAQNAPIQGLASEVGCAAGNLILRSSVEYQRRIKDKLSRIKYNRTVHDANYFTTAYAMLIPNLHIVQYEATYGVSKWYKEVFGLTMPIEPEIELEISAHQRDSFKWDWSLSHLAEVVIGSLKSQMEINRLQSIDVPSVVKTICLPWIDKEERAFLQENYPLLGVTDLDDQIDIFLSKMKAFSKEHKT